MALSARALAQSAARAGFETLTIDLFVDADTVAAAGACEQVLSDRRGITPASLSEAIARVRPFEPEWLVCGSGFEGRPGLLDMLAAAFPAARLAGSPSSAVAAAKNPSRLGAVLETAGIAYAPVRLSGNVDDGWLMKAIGASGGAHVRAAMPGERIADGWYAQRRIAGHSMSALFVSDGDGARRLGLCRHWRGPGVAATSFAHSGLVTTPASPAVAAQLDAVGHCGMQALGLRGLWGVDFILGEDERPTIVEINPRPTAAFELFDGSLNLFRAHVEPRAPIAATGTDLDTSRAAVVFHATASLRIPDRVRWPDWVADRPPAGSRIPAGAPTCTVLATAASPEAAVALASERCRLIGEGLRGADGINKSY